MRIQRLAFPDFHQLAEGKQLGEKGFFPGEPLLVIFDESKKKYISIEGNRRYTATYLLRHPEKAPVRKSTINDIATNANHRPLVVPVVDACRFVTGFGFV